MLTREIVLDELSEYPEYCIEELKALTNDELFAVFNRHCAKYSERVKASDVHNIGGTVAIDTPDGYQLLGDYWIKGGKEIYSVRVSDGEVTKVSGDHLFQTEVGWMYAKDLSNEHCILTKQGFRSIVYVRKHNETESTYDWEVLHENHRYWTASGLSSHNTGKTYLILNMCREAQKKGYFVVFYDSENAVDEELAAGFGIDLNMFRYEPVQTVQEFRSNVTQFVDLLIEQKEAGNEIPKVFIVLDSAGNLATQKEIDDAKSFSDKSDMSRAKVMKSIFRILMSKLGLLGANFVFSNHIYKTLDLYAQNVQSGGTGIIYGASIILNLSKAKLKESDGSQSGIIVTAKPEKNRFCKPTVVKFHISYDHGMNPYVGLEEYMSWDACGVERGKFITDKEYAKLSEADKKNARQHPMDEKVYMLPSPTGRGICTKHSTTAFPLKEIFTKNVWTAERLAEMQAYLKPIFEYAHHTDDEVEEIIGEDGE